MSVQHILVVAGLIIILFFAHKIPEIAKSLGKGLKGFSDELKEPK